ncbi:Uncharacterised protein [Vibrio cholerae]|nr:Uncharacterised protein [Vibrio cholerae]
MFINPALNTAHLIRPHQQFNWTTDEVIPTIPTLNKVLHT